MDEEHARELLAKERARVEQALGIHAEGALEADDRVEPGDQETEDLYQDELDEGRQGDLRDQLWTFDRERRADSRWAARGYSDRRADRR
jgi:hypothetical protein